MSSDFVVAARYSTLPEASLAKDALAQEGIASRLSHEHANHIMPHLATAIPIEIWVAPQDLATAQEVLNIAAMPSSEPPIEGEKSRLFRYAYRNSILGVVFLPGIASYLALSYLLKYFQAPGQLSEGEKPFKIALCVAFIVVGFAFFGVLLTVSLNHLFHGIRHLGS